MWMLSSQGLGVFTQAAYFILVARALDSTSYGAFISVAAVASIVFPFVGLGSGNILIKNVSKAQELFPEQWGNALVVSLCTGIPAILIIFLSSSLLFPADLPRAAIALLLFSDILSLRLLETSSAAFMAVFQVKRVAQIKVFANVCKLTAAIILFIFFRNSGILTWSVLYFISSLLPATLAFLIIHRSVGKPVPNITKFKPELAQGVLFSVDLSAGNINANVDKAMLGNIAGLQVAGIYGAGYRFIDICYTVIFALSGATYAHFFKHGESGIKGSFGFAKKILPIAFIYGSVTTASLFFLAPTIVPLMLGEDYIASVDVVKWLSAIHLFSYVQILGADVLTGAGFQGYRSAIQLTSAFLNIGLNLWLIPVFSWRGAVSATLASEVFKTLSLWLIIVLLYRRNVVVSKSND